MAFIIYSETEFDSIYGPIRKGEEINTIMAGPEDEQEIRKFLIKQYLEDGISVSYKITETGKKGKILTP